MFAAEGVTGARALPGPAAPVTSSAPLACMSGSMPALGGMAPVSAASATASSGRHECALASPALSGTTGVHPVWGGPVRMRSVARVGPPLLLALPIQLVRPLLLRLRLRMQANRKLRCLLLPLGSLALVGVALGVTTWLRTGTALPNWVLQVLVRVCSPRLVLPGPAWGLVVVLPRLLQVLWKTTLLVLPIHSTWIGMTPLGLFFASSRSFIAWRNQQV